jgi:integrase
MKAANKRYLTDRTLKAEKPADPGKTFVIWDAGQDHLGVRVGDKLRQHVLFGDTKARPSMTFVVLGRRAGDGKPIWRKVGRYPEMSLAKARDAAREVLGVLAAGKHPKQIAEDQRREEERKRKDSVAAVADEFLRRHAKKLRSAKGVEAVIRREVLGQKYDAEGKRWITDPTRKLHLRDKPITEVTRRDIVEIVEAVVDRGAPYLAHHVLAHTRKMFNWALARDVFGIENNPCQHIKSADIIGRPEARDRVLADHELRLIWAAAKAKAYPFGDLVRALLLTGQRLSEIAEARRREIDGDVLVVPAERMKNKQRHVVPLTSEVAALFDNAPRFKDGDDFLFTTTFGARPVSGFSKAKADLDKTIAALVAEERKRGLDTKPVAPWRIHDLRRTARTRMSTLGVLPFIGELVLAHVQTGVHAVYDLHKYDAEKRAALERWQTALLAIVEPRAPDEGVADLAKERAKRRSKAKGIAAHAAQ